MLLPSPPADSLQEIPYAPLIQNASQRKAVDKALVEKAVTIRILDELPAVLDNALQLALTSESDSVRLDATKYLIDRVAGKTVDRVQSVSISATLSADQVKEKLNHLLANNETYAEEDQLPEERSQGACSREDV